MPEIKCSICNNVFLNNASLGCHIEKTHPDFQLACIDCNVIKNYLTEKLSINGKCKACRENKRGVSTKIVRSCKLCNKSKNINDFYIGQSRCIECLKSKEKCIKCDKEYSVRYIKEHTNRCNGKKKDERLCNHCLIYKSLVEFSVGKYTCKDCLKAIVVCSSCKQEYRYRNQKEHKIRCVLKTSKTDVFLVG